MRTVLAGAAVLAVMSLAACGASGDSDHAEPRHSARWQSVAESPLSPRHGSAAVWTGLEIVIVGGDTHVPCPPNADCAFAAEPTASAAAYNPATDSWRELPDAPEAIAGAHAAWTGAEMIVVSGRDTLALDPERGKWRRLDTSPGVGDFVVSTDTGVVFVAYDQHPGKGPVDWQLDPDTGRWSALPRDPFGESYDRSMAWDGERLWLVSMAVENHFAAHEGAASRLAVLEAGQWRVVEPETPPIQYEQDVWWFHERLVVPTSSYGEKAHAYDPGTGEWTTLEPSDERSCPIPPAGPGEHWLSGGGSALVSFDPKEAVSLPACPEFDQEDYLGPDVAVWAGEALFIWGADFKRAATMGRLWTPAAPG